MHFIAANQVFTAKNQTVLQIARPPGTGGKTRVPPAACTTHQKNYTLFVTEVHETADHHVLVCGYWGYKDFDVKGEHPLQNHGFYPVVGAGDREGVTFVRSVADASAGLVHDGTFTVTPAGGCGGRWDRIAVRHFGHAPSEQVDVYAMSMTLDRVKDPAEASSALQLLVAFVAWPVVGAAMGLALKTAYRLAMV